MTGTGILARDLADAEHSICVTDLSAIIVIQNGSGVDAATRIYTIDNALELAHQLIEAAIKLRRPPEPYRDDRLAEPDVGPLSSTF